MENINQKAITELSELLHKNNLKEIEYEAENVRIRVVANTKEIASVPVAVNQLPAASVSQSALEVQVKGTEIKSPMVGVVYLSSDPDSAPFVREGDMIGIGQVVCLVEAMKTFNPVKSTVAGRVKKVLVQSGEPVEFNEPLFVVE